MMMASKWPFLTISQINSKWPKMTFSAKNVHCNVVPIDLVWYGMVWFPGISALPKRPQLVPTRTQQKGQSKLPPYKLRIRPNFSRSRRAVRAAGEVPRKWSQTIPTSAPPSSPRTLQNRPFSDGVTAPECGRSKKNGAANILLLQKVKTMIIIL